MTKVIGLTAYRKCREEYGEPIAKLVASGVISSMEKIEREPKFWDINLPDFSFQDMFIDYEIDATDGNNIANCAKGKLIYEGHIEYPLYKFEWVDFFVRIFQILDGNYIIYNYSACLHDDGKYYTEHEEEYDTMYLVKDIEMVNTYIEGCIKVGFIQV